MADAEAAEQDFGFHGLVGKGEGEVDLRAADGDTENATGRPDESDILLGRIELKPVANAIGPTFRLEGGVAAIAELDIGAEAAIGGVPDLDGHLAGGRIEVNSRVDIEAEAGAGIGDGPRIRF